MPPWEKKELTSKKALSIYNNILCSLTPSTQERVHYSILWDEALIVLKGERRDGNW